MRARSPRVWGVELFEHTSVGDVTGSFECREHDGLHVWEDTVLVEGIDPDGTDAVADGERCELVATSLFNRTAPLIRYRSDDIVRLTRAACACGRTHARMWPIGRKSDEIVVDGRSVLPIDVWAAVESVDACAMGLFQVIRTAREGRHAAAARRVRGPPLPATARRGHATRCGPRSRRRSDVEPDVELVPNDALLQLGPPHKIPRVAPR